LVGLGYFDLPQDMNAAGMVLAQEHLYVTAQGMDFPNIQTEHENQTWLLVYDRETRLPGDLPPGADAKDRDIIYKVPLPVEGPPSEMIVKDKLLIANMASEGLLFISLADAERPVVLRKVDRVIRNGVPIDLNVESISIQGDYLSASFTATRFSHRAIFDLSKPSTPQINEILLPEGVAGDPSLPLLGLDTIPKTIYSDNGVGIFDDAIIQNPTVQGQYQANGFNPLKPTHRLGGYSTLVSSLSHQNNKKLARFREGYLTVYDISRPDQVNIQDSLRFMFAEAGYSQYESYGPLDKWPFVHSDDGLLVAATRQSSEWSVGFVDTFSLDLVATLPSQFQVGVSTDTDIALTFNRSIDVPSAENLQQYLSRYLSLLKDTGTAQGEAVEFSIQLDINNPNIVRLIPDAALSNDTDYRLELSAEPSDGGRRATGLFEYTLNFSTGQGTGAQPVITKVSPSMVSTQGGEIKVELANSVSPTFTVSGEAASIVGELDDGAGIIEYTLRVPSSLAGPATLEVLETDGRNTRELGAFHYIEPLVLESISPSEGSVVGGTSVILLGRGFQAGEDATRIKVGNNSVPAQDIRVIDSQTVEFITPPGQLGLTSITVSTDSQSEILEDVFTYLQPVRTNIDGEKVDRIYDIVVDPTGTYAVAAVGNGGVIIYNIDSSTLTADVEDVTNADELRELVDKDGDGVDDRVEARIRLPGGYAALGVDLFFERNNDRIFVTAARIGSSSKDAKLFIYAIDSIDISQSTLVKSLDLGANFAKGIEVKNNQATVAMAEQGLGFVDAFLQSKIYLSDSISLTNNKPVLDVVRITDLSNEVSDTHYAIVAGEFDLANNRLIDREIVGAGGFHIIERSPVNGLEIVSSIDMPASKVLLSETNAAKPRPEFAYLSAGENGVVIVDISDLKQPRIVFRIAGTSLDIAISGNVLYVAAGQQGIMSYDITDPQAPVYIDSYEGFNGNSIETVFATPYSIIGGGKSAIGLGVLQETPDAVLKLHSVDPANGILDNDTDGDLKVRLRFNKAIDLFPENAGLFTITDSTGALIATRVEIQNNDALLFIDEPGLLEVGQSIFVIAEEGIVAAKPIVQDGAQINLELYRLESTQTVELIYRGARPETIAIDAVVPRRIPAATSAEVTISGLGIPDDTSRVRAYVGSLEMEILEIEQNSEDERIAILTANVPPIAAAGQYDVRLQIEKSGVWQSVVLRAGLQVDAPIQLDALTPLWGPLGGGTRVTLYGAGFEPGNTVSEGVTLEIGSQPKQVVNVLSSRKIEVITPRGVTGRNTVFAQDRYGNRAELRDERGFGYGIRQLSNVRASLVNPVDVVVDQDTGVAAVATGYFSQFGSKTMREGGLNESFFAATFDVQNPSAPLLVGGLPTLPSDLAGLRELERYQRFVELSNKADSAEFLRDTPALTAAEEAELVSLAGVGANIPFSIDSQRLALREEVEDGITRKRLYVASGHGGVARLNFDEQNGLQLTGRTKSDGLVRDLAQTGYAAFTASAAGVNVEQLPKDCSAVIAEAQGSGFSELSFINPNDPVLLNNRLDTGSGSMLFYEDGWLFRGGSTQGAAWGPCPPSYQSETAAAPIDSDAGTLSSVNIFDPLLTSTYAFDGNVFDLVTYGDYLVIALGRQGIEIVHRDRPEERMRFSFDGLQASTPSAQRLKISGNLLFVSASGGGVIVLDLATPLQPKVVSAGNSESIVALDVYRDRIIAGADAAGLRTMQVPAAFVLDTNIDHEGLIADNEKLRITFNEAVTVESVEASGTVSIVREDDNTSENVVIEAVNVTDSSARIFDLVFDREAGVSYRININNAASSSVRRRLPN